MHLLRQKVIYPADNWRHNKDILIFLHQKMKETLWDAYSMPYRPLVDNEKGFDFLTLLYKCFQD